VHSIASALRREFHTGFVVDSLWVEAMGIVLTGQLLRRWCTNTAQRSLKGQLSQADLRLTLDMIEQNLVSDLSIKMLADRVGIGSHQFTREFKAVTGRTPYRFIVERRIERARALLVRTN
jgi:AraC family transcriptional regulator